MAKALSKFSQTYAKLESDIKKFSESEIDGRKQRIAMARSNITIGEDHLGDSMAKARKEGVTGSKLEDFSKSKDFKEALGLLGKAAKEFDGEVEDAKKWSAQAAALLATLTKLSADIDKDLKSRKDKSESKNEIVDLQAELAKKIKIVTKASKLHADLPKPRASYDLPKAIDMLLKKAPEALQQSLDSTMMPQKLVDRNRKGAVSKAASLAKEIKAACDDALKLAADDKKSAADGVKAAMASLKDMPKKLQDLKAVHDDFKEAYDYADKRKMIAGTKDEKAVEDAMKMIANAYALAERSLRGTVTTLKKSQG